MTIGRINLLKTVLSKLNDSVSNSNYIIILLEINNINTGMHQEKPNKFFDNDIYKAEWIMGRFKSILLDKTVQSSSLVDACIKENSYFLKSI